MKIYREIYRSLVRWQAGLTADHLARCHATHKMGRNVVVTVPWKVWPERMSWLNWAEMMSCDYCVLYYPYSAPYLHSWHDLSAFRQIQLSCLFFRFFCGSIRSMDWHKTYTFTDQQWNLIFLIINRSNAVCLWCSCEVTQPLYLTGRQAVSYPAPGSRVSGSGRTCRHRTTMVNVNRHAVYTAGVFTARVWTIC